jgi:cytochrome c-type biogenesis protein CcmH
MFWIAAVFLVMIVMLGVYVPLSRVAKADTTKPALIRALAAELAEVNADKGVRFSSQIEADAARAEIGRRLLALEATPDPANLQPRSSQAFALFALLPILAVPLYVQLGAPEYADQNFSTRMDANPTAGQEEIAKLIERVEQRLKQRPDDAEGWAVIAPIYFRMGRVDDSLKAYAKAIEFHKGDLPQKSRLMADRAEIIVAAASGKVSAEAASAFSAALGLDKDNQKALFYSAITLEQSGKADEARANWQTLISRFKGANPPWLQIAEQRLAGLGGTPKLGPTPDQVEAAGDMTPEQRQDMIKSMVEGLAAKLKDNPDNIEGWLQLIRSQQVLGNAEQAALDLAAARAQFADGSNERASIEALATSLGI